MLKIRSKTWEIISDSGILVIWKQTKKLSILSKTFSFNCYIVTSLSCSIGFTCFYFKIITFEEVVIN